MAQGVRITVTNFKLVREQRRDDVRVKVWTGTQWTYLCWWPYSPDMAAICGTKPHVDSVTLEFLPPGIVPHDSLAYARDILPMLRRSGVVR